MAYSYFEGLVFLLFYIPTLLVVVLDVVSVSLGVFPMIIIYALGGSVLGRVVPFLRSNVDDRYIGYNVMDIYYLDFLIGVVLNKISFLSIL